MTGTHFLMQMRKAVVLGLGMCCMLVANMAAADNAALELTLGRANDGIDVYRLAWHKSWSRHWFVSDSGELTGYHALSLNRWQGPDEGVNVVAYSPVFVYRLNTAPVTYLKFGVGAAWLSASTIQTRHLGSHLQFEDQLGVGWQWGLHDLSLGYLHYSNAGFSHPNDGMDIVAFSYARRF